tara:strand:+ start:113 stop:604 length:492 start_codon:yes stop_codon:yes gene_type:complete
MRRFLCTPILFVFFVSCSGYEFTYSKDPKIKEIEKKTNYVIVGDDISIAKIKLIEELGRSGVDSVFLLNVGIEKISTPIVIEKDATVSKTEIKHSVSYSLLNEIKNCEILSKNVTTKSTYSSSSSGYSFSTDLSEEEVITKNLNNNIDEFLDYVVSFNGDLSC